MFVFKSFSRLTLLGRELGRITPLCFVVALLLLLSVVLKRSHQVLSLDCSWHNFGKVSLSGTVVHGMVRSDM